jgi:DNA primase catalytic core
MTATLDRKELEDLKASVDLVALFEATGAPLKKIGKGWFCRCPFHADTEASLSVSPEDRLWNCFGCEAAGDGLAWLQLREGLNFPQSIARLREFAGTPKPAPAPKAAPELDRNALLTRVMERYFQRFKECPEAQQYLTERGLSSRELWETFRIGYADGTLLKSLPSGGAVREQLTQLGILNAEGNEHFRGCVVIPLDHPDDGLVGFYGRRLDPNGAVQHLYLPGPKRGVLQWQALKRGKRVWVTESVLDALSLWQAGIKDVTCLYGAGHMHKDLEKLLGSLATHEVVFCLDGDEAGQKATQRFAERLAERGLVCEWTPLPDGLDPNEILLERGPDGLRDLVSRPRPLLAPAPMMAESEPQATATSEGFTLKVGDVQYKVTMVPPFVGRLRALVVASCGSNLYSEKLDLHSQRARALNAGQLVRSLELTRAEAERHFTLILKEALAWVDSQKLEDSSTRKKVPVLDPDERNAALAFLKRKDLVPAILADCEALGFVGEEKAKLLVYLIGISRKLPKPLSGIVVSQSGAGKSALTELVEQLAPPEDVLLYSRFTPQALFYMSHDLKGLILIMEERAGGEAADYSIRTLQSRQKLSLLAPVKDPVTGKMTTQSYEVEGPVAYLETTTNPHLNPENASRCFELYMDESEEQTQRIQAQQKKKRLPSKTDSDELAERIKTRHHNAQRMLEPMKVFIPYADKIAFPTQWLRTRRDNERFLCLIEAIAFLHQHQRERGELSNGKPYVMANLQDYRLAYELAQDVLSSTFHELTREARSLWELLVPYVNTRDSRRPKDVVFTLKDLRPVTNYANHQLRRGLQELVEMEYAVQLQSQNGVPAQFSLLAFDLQQGTLPGLTTPDQLEQLWRPGR